MSRILFITILFLFFHSSLLAEKKDEKEQSTRQRVEEALERAERAKAESGGEITTHVVGPSYGDQKIKTERREVQPQTKKATKN